MVATNKEVKTQPKALRSNAFYKFTYPKAMKGCLLLVGVIFCLMGVITFIEFTKDKPKYYAIGKDNQLIPLVALNKRNLNTQTLLNWASIAATTAYTYDFFNYENDIASNRRFFTNEGYELYKKALTDSKNLSDVRAKKLIVSAVPTNTPVILWESPSYSHYDYAWKIQLPLLVSYQSANDIIRQNLIISMLVVRISSLIDPAGIGIASFEVLEGGYI